MHLHLSRAVPLLPGTCNWIILWQTCQAWETKKWNKNKTFCQEIFYFWIWSKTIFSWELALSEQNTGWKSGGTDIHSFSCDVDCTINLPSRVQSLLISELIIVGTCMAIFIACSTSFWSLLLAQWIGNGRLLKSSVSKSLDQTSYIEGVIRTQLLSWLGKLLAFTLSSL